MGNNHLAYYRKYRPKTFDDVCGQDHISNVLKYEVREGHLSHAYLFCGSRGTGKTSCARILAKAANCLSPENGNPCGKCENCLAIENGSAIDVVEIDAASNNGIEDIRQISDEVSYAAAFLKRKVYIIDEVHMLSTSAFNALLKTLEEPPQGVIFILATTEFNKLPTTIVSRCQRYDFRRITTDIIVGRLDYIAEKEGINLDRNGAVIIARQAYGGMRDAVNLLDLCATINNDVTAKNVSDILGISRRDLPDRTARAIKNKSLEELYDIIYEVDHSSCDISVFFGDLLSYWRDMLVASTVSNFSKYLDLTEEETLMLKESSKLFTKKELLFQPMILENALTQMKDNPAVKRNIAETSLIKLCHPEYSSSLEALNVRIEELEKKIDELKLGVGFSSAVATNNTIVVNESNITENSNPSENNSKETISDNLSENEPDDYKQIIDIGEINEYVGNRDRMLSPYIGMCEFYFSDRLNTVKIIDKDSFSGEFFTKSPASQILISALIKCKIADENTKISYVGGKKREDSSVLNISEL